MDASSLPYAESVTTNAALVQMGSVDEARKAREVLNGYVPQGTGPIMFVRYSEQDVEPTDNLFVKGLPRECPEFVLRMMFKEFGTILRLRILPGSKQGEVQYDNSFALVQMSSVAEAQAALTALHGKQLPVSAHTGPTMLVKFAGKDGHPGCNLYVAGLLCHTKDEQIRAAFSQCGTVIRIKRLVTPGKMDVQALVEMASTQEASACIQRLNGSPLESGEDTPGLVVQYHRSARSQSDHDESMRGGSTARSRDEEALSEPCEEFSVQPAKRLKTSQDEEAEEHGLGPEEEPEAAAATGEFETELKTSGIQSGNVEEGLQSAPLDIPLGLGSRRDLISLSVPAFVLISFVLALICSKKLRTFEKTTRSFRQPLMPV
eukprot:gnl/TRDRNA2_/TRDRNA2_164360_c0_seq3.p1 gnl/TRDRNA2_/TRDRNA2_164360_c0~~gnl/TRDRNA2_/TRDRNA2_164360_c0_seq3.p1  ORF type:complete len:375 (+),score=57.16 gnl/TRDRNA2_/TRDRNA2_164360_c0_seq3:167-1291(+)